MLSILDSLQSSGLAETIRNSLYLFPLIEPFHVIGLTLVFGTAFILDMRLLGVASTRTPFSKVARDIVKWTWAAFVLTVLTGLLMFSTNAVVYFHNPMFRFKMLALALAGLNMLIFEFTAGRTMHRPTNDPTIPPAGRLAGVVSLILWIAVIFFGRWIGFTTTGNETPDVDIKIEGIFKN